MIRLTKMLLAATLGLMPVVGGAAHALQDEAAQLRASGRIGERFDGYLGDAGGAPSDLRARMEQVNIQRRAAYTQLAGQRGATIEEVAAATACQLLSTRVLPGQKYLLADGAWRTRNGSEPVPLPGHCG